MKDEDLPTMTLTEFHEQAKRDKLVLFDDYVAKVSGFMREHPGGPFLIERVIGSDIG